ncbi:MAG: phosphoenolpyruvate carboxykinase (GTP) [Phycisphaerae bacterium]|nr:phosphoenolpyruvate carboxykinase (GTP) [Phycisphaerae bacterium]
MDEKISAVLKNKMDDASFAKLNALNNADVFTFVADAIELCTPAKVVVCDDSAEDIAWIRQQAIDNGEEVKLNIEGHTVHFDGYSDQAREKGVTKYLVPADVELDKKLNQTDRDEGLAEINGFFTGAMAGKTMYVRFLCLGPCNSQFSIPCLQVTDSAYVAHSEDLLYRAGYEEFKRHSQGDEFFKFLHSAGRLGDDNTSADTDKKRVYMDYTQNTVLSVNTQYAGNTVGLKKLALRLAIRKADREGWLAEHMFIMGCNGPAGRVTYFTGAFPSACGKTSTAMLPGETIVGDDLAYFKIIDEQVRAVNVEDGIFGIIADVNAKDDPVIFDVLKNPGEVIFGNVLAKDGTPYWMGMGEELPTEGTNYAGDYKQGATGPDGAKLNPSHKNARYTVKIRDLANRDELADDPNGVPVGGVIYGGRDSDTCVPVQQSFDWAHGVVSMGASLESETTAATIGAEGVRKFNLMSNMDFLSMSLGKYIQNNLDFGGKAAKTPLVFGTNYFLKKDGEFLNGKLDKGIWMKWMELRVHGEADAITAPTGMLPKYEDLRDLFKTYRDADYTQQQYVDQFTIRIPENLAKLDRIEKIYQDVADAPAVVLETIKAQRQRLEELQAAKGDYVSPMEL